MENKKFISNVKIDKIKGIVFISVNTKIYALESIYSSAYIFLDKAYILIDGDPKKEVIVELKPKKEYDLEKLGGEFNNELLNYVTYSTLAKKNEEIRKMLLQRALFNVNVPEENNKINNVGPQGSYDKSKQDELKELIKELDIDDDDSDNTSIPWEDEYKEDKTQEKLRNALKKANIERENKNPPKKFKIIYNKKEEEINEGDALIDACEKLGVQFGCTNGVCGTCKIEIISGSKNLSKLTEAEKELGADNKNRFACQCKMGGGNIKIIQHGY